MCFFEAVVWNKTPARRIRRTTFCGFRSSAHLKTLFRKSFGMTMSEFRRSY
jgi:transcriptional regulator GlxA family with amidase domain